MNLIQKVLVFLTLVAVVSSASIGKKNETHLYTVTSSGQLSKLNNGSVFSLPPNVRGSFQMKCKTTYRASDFSFAMMVENWDGNLPKFTYTFVPIINSTEAGISISYDALGTSHFRVRMDCTVLDRNRRLDSTYAFANADMKIETNLYTIAESGRQQKLNSGSSFPLPLNVKGFFLMKCKTNTLASNFTFNTKVIESKGTKPRFDYKFISPNNSTEVGINVTYNAVGTNNLRVRMDCIVSNAGRVVDSTYVYANGDSKIETNLYTIAESGRQQKLNSGSSFHLPLNVKGFFLMKCKTNTIASNFTFNTKVIESKGTEPSFDYKFISPNNSTEVGINVTYNAVGTNKFRVKMDCLVYNAGKVIDSTYVYANTGALTAISGLALILSLLGAFTIQQ